MNEAQARKKFAAYFLDLKGSMATEGGKVGKSAEWERCNLLILAEMAADHGLPQWYVDEVKRIGSGLQVMPVPPTH